VPASEIPDLTIGPDDDVWATSRTDTVAQLIRVDRTQPLVPPVIPALPIDPVVPDLPVVPVATPVPVTPVFTG